MKAIPLQLAFVDVDSKGKSLDANEIFGTVEAVKTVSDLYLPIKGTITEVNPELESNPEYVNQDPYGKGWMIKMTIENISDADSLMDAAAYQELVGA